MGHGPFLPCSTWAWASGFAANQIRISRKISLLSGRARSPPMLAGRITARDPHDRRPACSPAQTLPGRREPRDEFSATAHHPRNRAAEFQPHRSGQCAVRLAIRRQQAHQDLEGRTAWSCSSRKGKRFLGLTDPGKELLVIVERMLLDAANIRRLAEQFSQRDEGQLTIATTHTQARYALRAWSPPSRRRFRKCIWCCTRPAQRAGAPVAGRRGRHRHRHRSGGRCAGAGVVSVLQLASRRNRPAGAPAAPRAADAGSAGRLSADHLSPRLYRPHPHRPHLCRRRPERRHRQRPRWTPT